MRDLDDTPTKFDTKSSYGIMMTKPDNIVRHDISDEELEMLADEKPDRSLEIMMTAIGAVLGSAPGCLNTFYNYFWGDQTKISFEGFLHMMIFVSAALITVTVIFINRGSRGKKAQLVSSIRGRGMIKS